MMNRRAKIAISTSVALCGVQLVVAEPADTLQRTKVLSEVVVTASESRKATSASRIDVTALKHLQPSSFTDILELLPGGRAVDPAMGTVNSIRLRVAGLARRELCGRWRDTQRRCQYAIYHGHISRLRFEQCVERRGYAHHFHR